MHQSLEYYKTFYIGTQDKIEIPIEESILFDDINILSYDLLVSTLTNFFWKSAFEYQQGIRNYPKHIRILVPFNHKNGFKSQPHHKNTTIQTLEWFLQNFLEPPGGIIISIYFYNNLFPGLDNPWCGLTIWPLKQQWVGDGNYVTIHRLPKNYVGSSKRIERTKAAGHWDLIQNIEKYCPYPVIEINYGNEKFATESLIHSKRHFAYPGASYYLAGIIDIPTVTYGGPMHKYSWKSILFDQKTIYENRKNEIRYITHQKGLHQQGFSCGSPSRVYHFDRKRQVCMQKPQTFTRHAWDRDELLGYITFTKDLIIDNRDRENWVDLSDIPIYNGHYGDLTGEYVPENVR
jgi:hypothetical protein